MKAWILASVIIERTHVACGSMMEAATAAISSLGFALDLMVQRVLTLMRRGARCGAVVQAHGQPELGFGQEHARGSKLIARSWGGCGCGSVSHLFFQRKPSANLYACQDQVSRI
jgi:hypothetical protein